MAASVDAILELFPNRRILPVVAMLADKDVAGALRHLQRLGDGIVVTQSEYERALPLEKLAEAASDLFKDVRREKTIAEAIESALGRVDSEDIILITGSLFNVAEVRKFMSGRGAPAA